jgi:hypothetical protein
MRAELFTDALLNDISRMAAMGDQPVQDAAERIAAGLGPAVKMHLLDLLGQVAVDLSEQVEGGRVEVRLVGSEPELILVHEQAVPATPETPATPAADEPSGDDTEARISLRLPARLKVRVESAADSEGVSTNTWIVKTLVRSTSEPNLGSFAAGLGALRGLDLQNLHNLSNIQGIQVVRGRNRLKGYGQS